MSVSIETWPICRRNVSPQMVYMVLEDLIKVAAWWRLLVGMLNIEYSFLVGVFMEGSKTCLAPFAPDLSVQEGLYIYTFCEGDLSFSVFELHVIIQRA